MSNYISSFLIEPVIRQARRFSRPHDDGDSAPSTSQLQHVPAEDQTIHAGGRLAVTTAHGVRAVQDVLSASAWPQIIPGQPVVLSPSSEDGGLEAELAHLRDREQRTSSPSNSQRQSTHHSLTDILRGNAVGVDDDTSDNPLYGIPDQFRSTTTSFSSLNSLNDAAVTPTEGHTRSRANTGRGSYSYSSRMGDGSLPADDGMGHMRRRIKDIQEQDTSNAEKARLIHGLMTEQYSSSQPSLHAAPFHRANSPASLLSQDRPFTPNSDHSMNDSGLFASPPTSLSSVTVADNPYNLTPDDLIPTYMPKPVPPVPGTAAEKAQFFPPDPEEEERPPSLGCKHYKRNVKLQCSTCSRWYTCRFCHDEAEDHSLKRRETKNMLCMLCGCAQPAGEECIDCGEQTARYYCNVCKLWDDASEKSIYHCNDCGICRVGQGLGKDFYHCKVSLLHLHASSPAPHDRSKPSREPSAKPRTHPQTCCVCMSITIRDTHRCIERSTDCDCPICGDYMFTSPQTVVFMRCGHSIHQRCYYEHMESSYRCPICSRSIVNMEMQFRQLDRTIEAQPMPPQFRDTTAWVYCNDCCAKTSVRYHWLGLKCGV